MKNSGGWDSGSGEWLMRGSRQSSPWQKSRILKRESGRKWVSDEFSSVRCQFSFKIRFCLETRLREMSCLKWYSLRVNLLSLLYSLFWAFLSPVTVILLSRDQHTCFLGEAKPSICLWDFPLNYPDCPRGIRKLNPLGFTQIQPWRTCCYIILAISWLWYLSVLGFGQLVRSIAAMLSWCFCFCSWGRDTIN